MRYMRLYSGNKRNYGVGRERKEVTYCGKSEGSGLVVPGPNEGQRLDALNATHKSRKWGRTDSLLQTAACSCGAKVRGWGDFNGRARVECRHSTRCSAKDSRDHVFGHSGGVKACFVIKRGFVQGSFS